MKRYFELTGTLLKLALWYKSDQYQPWVTRCKKFLLKHKAEYFTYKDGDPDGVAHILRPANRRNPPDGWRVRGSASLQFFVPNMKHPKGLAIQKEFMFLRSPIPSCVLTGVRDMTNLEEGLYDQLSFTMLGDRAFVVVPHVKGFLPSAEMLEMFEWRYKELFEIPSGLLDG